MPLRTAPIIQAAARSSQNNAIQKTRRLLRAGERPPDLSAVTPDATQPTPGTGMKRAMPTTTLAPLPRKTVLRPIAPQPIPKTPTTSGAQQTESANPLTGDGNAVPGGAAVPVVPPAPMSPGRALGASARGASARVPAGQDMAAPGAEDDMDGDEAAAGHVGGDGAYQRTFSNPVSAGIYSDYVKRLGLGGAPIAQPRKPGIKPAPDQDSGE